MMSIWSALWRFVNSMDAKAWRAALVTLGLLASVMLVFLIGKTDVGVELSHEVELWLMHFRGSPWAVFIVIFVFVLAAFIGAPQFVLIAACVVAFGHWQGFAYSWLATIVSAAVTFYVGRLAGAKMLARLGSETLNRLTRFIGSNAFMGSFIIRNVPSAPFIVVNMAFGASGAPFWRFLGGCALGVLPKTALVALFGSSFTALMSGEGGWKGALMMAAFGLAWLGLMLAARHYLTRRAEARQQPDPQ